MYCTCGKQKDGYTVALLDGEPQWGCWVCANCHKLSQTVFRKLTNMYAPFGAKACLSVYGRANGISEIRWAMEDGTRKTTIEFHPYPRKVDMNAGESLLRRTWELLDSKVDIILAEPNGPGDNALEAAARERARYEARGIAETLAIHMKPFFESADDIVKEAVKRHKARKAGAAHETPGLAEHLWDPNTNWDGTPRVKVAEPKSRTRPVAAPKKAAPKVDNTSTKQLTPEEADGIREAVASGMFSKEDVASMFKVSLATVEQALAS